MSAFGWCEVFSWGSDEFGQLGHHGVDGGEAPATAAAAELDIEEEMEEEIKKLDVISDTYVIFPSPVDLPPSHRIVQRVACGEEHTLFLTSGGTVLACGSSASGQCGTGMEALAVAAPTAVMGVSDVVSIAAGPLTSAAITRAGQLFVWGAGMYGQLGLGDYDNRSSPALVQALVDAGEHVTQVAWGGAHAICLTRRAAVYTWGQGWSGQLGHGDSQDTREPRLVEMFDPERAQAPTAEGAPPVPVDTQALARLDPGSIIEAGILAAQQHSGEHVPVARGAFVVKSVAAGGHHTAVVTVTADVYTWGRGDQGQLGHGDTAHAPRPRIVRSLRGQAWQVACGSYHTVVRTGGGDVYTFGSGDYGQHGQGDAQSVVPAPVQLAGLMGVREVASCGDRTAAVTRSGSVYVWGAYSGGVPDEGETCESMQPTPRFMDELDGFHVSQVALGAQHTVALCGAFDGEMAAVVHEVELWQQLTADADGESSSRLRADTRRQLQESFVQQFLRTYLETMSRMSSELRDVREHAAAAQAARDAAEAQVGDLQTRLARVESDARNATRLQAEVAHLSSRLAHAEQQLAEAGRTTSAPPAAGRRHSKK